MNSHELTFDSCGVVGEVVHADPVQRDEIPDQLALITVGAAGQPDNVGTVAHRPITDFVHRDLAAELARESGLIQRFHEKLWTVGGNSNECWLWLGSLNGGSDQEGTGRGGAGYGNFHIRYDKHPITGQLVEWIVYAHRVSWVLAGNPDLGPGKVFRHTCDERSCANPGHVIAGSRAQNYWDFRAREFHWLGSLNDPRSPLQRARDLKQAVFAAGASDLRQLFAPSPDEVANQCHAVAQARRAGHDRVGQGTLLPGA